MFWFEFANGRPCIKQFCFQSKPVLCNPRIQQSNHQFNHLESFPLPHKRLFRLMDCSTDNKIVLKLSKQIKHIVYKILFARDKQKILRSQKAKSITYRKGCQGWTQRRKNHCIFDAFLTNYLCKCECTQCIFEGKHWASCKQF